MMKRNYKFFGYFLISIFLTLGLSISFQSLLAAWTAPLANPPTCAAGNPGCDEPVNKGSFSQSKGGPLTVNFDNLASTGLVVYGNVGIGPAAPLDALHVVQAINTGSSIWNLGIKVYDSNAQAAGSGGGIVFGTKYTDAGAYANVAGIKANKINSTSGNYATGLTFYTTQNGGNALGKRVMDLSDTGNVGIGTTSPRFALEIGDSTNSQIAGVVTNSSAGGGAYAETQVRNGYAAGNTESMRMLVMGTNYSTTGGFVADSGVLDADSGLSNGMSLMTRANAPIRFYTNGHTNERMRIAGSGNVGIGTTTPVSALNVVSSVSGDQLRLGTIGPPVFSYKIGRNTSTGFLDFQGDQSPATGYNFNSAAGISLMRIINNGNVGIGTTGPGKKLQVVGGGIFGAENESWTFDDATNYRLGFVKKGGAYPTLAAASGAPITFSISNNSVLSSAVTGQTLSEKMRIDSNGNVGIGTPNPTAPLHIYKIGVTAWSLWERGDGSQVALQAGASYGSFGTYTNYPFVITVNNAEKMRIDTIGNVGIGTPLPGAKLEVAGQVKITGGSPGDGKVLTSDAAGLASWQTPTGGGGTVTSITAGTGLSGGTITTTGTIALNTANSNTWTAAQTFSGLNTSGAGYLNIATNIIKAQGTASEVAINYAGTARGFTVYNNTAPLFRVDSAGDVSVAQELTVSGNVGIGTPSPVVPLDVRGETRVSNSTDPSRYLTLRVSPGYEGEIYGPTTYGLSIYPNTGNPVAIRVSNTGNVGIGTAAPAQKLSVAGVIESTSGGIKFPDGTVQTTAGGGAGAEADTLQTVTSRGNTTNTNLVVNGQTFKHQADNPFYIDAYEGIQLHINENGGSSNFQINNSANSTVFTVTNAGNVGIGVTAPATKLNVEGDIRAGYFAGGSFLAQGAGGNVTTVIAGWELENSYINNGGNVGIGTVNPAEKLDVNGKVKATEFCIGASCINVWPTGGGTVTSITAGTGLSGGTITTSGTISLNLASANTWTALQTFNGDIAVGGQRICRENGTYCPAPPFTYWESAVGGISFNDGNVGIGTAAPAQKLSVAGVIESTTGGIKFPDGTVQATAGGGGGNIVDTLAATLGAGNDAGGNSIANLGNIVVNGQTFKHQADNPFYIDAYEGIQLHINENGGSSNFQINNSANSTVFTVTNDGNVGIGTAFPTNAKLQLMQSSNTVGGGIGIISILTNTALLLWHDGANSRIDSGNSGGSANGDILLNGAGNGNVGIGTASAAFLLDLGASTGRKLAVYETGAGADFFGFGISAGSLDIYAGGGGGPKMVINSSGNVGIGTAAAPSVKLEVAGNIIIGRGTSLVPGVAWGDSTATGMFGPVVNTVAFSTAGTEKMRINSTGNVGIGVTDPGLYKLYIGGTGYLGAAAWVYGSDRRLKENIVYFDGLSGLDKILELKPARFDLINGDKNQLGFIAQDVHLVIPEAVTVVDQKTGMLGLKTDFIIPYLVEAIKELAATFNNLAAKVEDLFKKFLVHDEQIQALEKTNLEQQKQIDDLKSQIQSIKNR